MKNIHVLPTKKPSRLLKDLVDKTYQFKKEVSYGNRFELPLNIYITSDEEIKEGDWVYRNTDNTVLKCTKDMLISVIHLGLNWNKDNKKIILTTDQDLIKDGVQAIDDEFLEWFVKNPNCEFVYVNTIAGNFHLPETYKIVIPKEEQTKCYCGHTTYCDCSPLEEPKQETENLKNFKKLVSDEISPAMKDFIKEKQETLEEAFSKTYLGEKISFSSDIGKSFELGAKWQEQRMYSEEDMREAFENGIGSGKHQVEYGKRGSMDFEYFIKQFKNK